jgi:uncharacterized LabA/DUF88 family protein
VRQPNHSGQTALVERYIAYIDGFNFYHGLMAKGWGRYRWLDFVALMQRRMRGPDDDLVAIRYFTTLIVHQPERLKRQTTYLNALRIHSGLEPIFGRFEMRDIQCQLCNEWYKRPQEKWTDVNIATHLVADAHANAFDTALLVSADADLVPAVQHIKERWGKRVILIDPPRRHSDDLAKNTDGHWYFARRDLNQCQLPDSIEYRTSRRKLRRYERPEDWR